MQQQDIVLKTLKMRYLSVAPDASGSVQAMVLKVRKSATFAELFDELAEFYKIGYRCGHQHDCCGCESFRIQAIKPLKRGEVYLRLESRRNV